MPPPDLAPIVVVAGLAALASVLGGALALVHRPSTLVMSTAFGLAGGALLGAITLEMVPKALQLGSLPLTLAGLLAGFLAVYGFDLFVHRGQLAGEHADQYRRVRRRYRRHPPLGGSALVIAAATSVEELIEGLTIGVSWAVQPGLAAITALAIALDNLSEGMSIGELIREEKGGSARRARREVFLWTGTVGMALFVSAMLGWALLRGLEPSILGLLVATGAGAMFYLTLGDLLPEGLSRQYQQSTVLAAGLSFALVLALSSGLS
jgi:ZIP family zinc transporter